MPTRIKTSGLTRTLVSKERFVPTLERSIAKNDYDWEFRYETKNSDDAWHPSGDCTPDLVTLYHIALDRLDPDTKPMPISSALRKTFMIGHFWHQWLQFHAVKSGICDEEAIEKVGTKSWGKPLWVQPLDKPGGQVPMNRPFHWTRGSADVCPAVNYTQDWIIDFKTMNPIDFAASNPPERYAAKWECQMNIYMDFFDFDQTCIIAIDKLTGAMKEFVYRRNQELTDAIYDKWKIVSECLDKNIEPSPDDNIELPLKGVSE